MNNNPCITGMSPPFGSRGPYPFIHRHIAMTDEECSQ